MSTSFFIRQHQVQAQKKSHTIVNIVCRPLEELGFTNAFSTRLGGVSPFPRRALNLHYKNDDKKNVDENRRRFLESLGLEGTRIITRRQTHSAHIVFPKKNESPKKERQEADALITADKKILIGVKTAD